MNGGRRVREGLKTALILLLIATAILMAIRVKPLRELFSHLSLGEIRERLAVEEGPAGEPDARLDLSTPVRMAYTKEEGRSVFQYDADALNTWYNPVSTLVSEAIGSAGEPQRANERLWRSALAREGLYLDYEGDVLLGMLAAWLGTEAPEALRDLTARRVLLAREDDTAELYFMSGSGEEIYRCSTAVRFAAVAAIFADIDAAEGSFAFELGEDYALLAPYTLVLDREYTASALTVSSLLDTEGADALFAALDFNRLTATSYPETDGSEVYVENDCTVRMGRDGMFSYRTISGADRRGVELPAGGEAAAAAAAAIAIAETSGVLDDGRVSPYLESMTRDENSITVRFGRTVQGIPVRRVEGESFLTMTVTDGIITLFELDTALLIPAEETVSLMPEWMAAAAAGSEGELEIVYLSDGRSAAPSWVMDRGR